MSLLLLGLLLLRLQEARVRCLLQHGLLAAAAQMMATALRLAAVI